MLRLTPIVCRGCGFACACDVPWAAAGLGLREAWEVWLRAWAGKVKAQEGGGAAAAVQMRRTSPKYVPREWMLVEAYTKANSGDYSEVEALHTLFKQPFDEQEDMEAKYYKKVRPRTHARTLSLAARTRAQSVRVIEGTLHFFLFLGMEWGACCVPAARLASFRAADMPAAPICLLWLTLWCGRGLSLHNSVWD